MGHKMVAEYLSIFVAQKGREREREREIIRWSPSTTRRLTKNRTALVRVHRTFRQKLRRSLIYVVVVPLGSITTVTVSILISGMACCLRRRRALNLVAWQTCADLLVRFNREMIWPFAKERKYDTSERDRRSDGRWEGPKEWASEGEREKVLRRRRRQTKYIFARDDESC